jgi:esterase/lipase
LNSAVELQKVCTIAFALGGCLAGMIAPSIPPNAMAMVATFIALVGTVDVLRASIEEETGSTASAHF